MSTNLDIELAKRIACAYVSYQTGITYEHLWKTRLKDANSINDYWIDIAKKVSDERSGMQE